ncbi:MAG TPA: hypothetical protein VM433_06890 [Mycobacteriales bacterium]|nr:hypothetical protein [Mycobacteriales bacterium]
MTGSTALARRPSAFVRWAAVAAGTAGGAAAGVAMWPVVAALVLLAGGLVLWQAVRADGGAATGPAAPRDDAAGDGRDDDAAGDERDDVVTVTDPVLTLSVTAAVVGGIVAAVALPTALAAAGAALVTLLVRRPVLAAYLWLGLTPLVVGIDRGTLLPLLRPNEALLVVLVGALLVRALLDWRARRPTGLRATRVEAGFVLLALTSAVLPALWSVAQGRGLQFEDVLSAANVLKYFAVYGVVRYAVRSQSQVRTCLWLSMGVCALVAVIAVLQSLRVPGVPELLATFWATGEDTAALANARGSATIGHTQGLADVMVFNLAIATAMLLRGAGPRRLLLPLAGLFLLGALASGQVSGVVGLVVGVVAVGYALRRLGTVLLGFLAVLPFAAVALLPVIAARLDRLDPSSGLPVSWIARWENLRTYFWPPLFEDGGWVLGVQLVPEAEGREVWQPTVWIESGHTWLLWIGGVPFLVAFFVFLAWVLTVSLRASSASGALLSVAGAASFAAWWTVAAGMFFDPHLFLRGSADLSFPLLALAVSAATSRPEQGGPPARDARRSDRRAAPGRPGGQR